MPRAWSWVARACSWLALTIASMRWPRVSTKCRSLEFHVPHVPRLVLLHLEGLVCNCLPGSFVVPLLPRHPGCGARHHWPHPGPCRGPHISASSSNAGTESSGAPRA
uniref:Putative secreted protein n=1 Tax=Ixodes ricinus TaxID=34613 RepID=A0A6B0UDZ2_IXORI